MAIHSTMMRSFHIKSHIRVRGKLPERRIPPLGVEKGLAGGKIVLLLLFAGPLAGPLVFDIQTPGGRDSPVR